ncbi:MAG: hypothetical protein KGL53_12450, partial [Elusimicrobia bacterium]|nr:hypothetical protein [Elusimicrobiota bacterium]
LTFRPVARANLIFETQAEDETYMATSGPDGRWSVTVPPRKGGFKLIVDQTRYLADYYDEVSPSYRTWSLYRRSQLRAAKPMHAPWLPGQDGTLRRDFYLIPSVPDQDRGAR